MQRNSPFVVVRLPGLAQDRCLHWSLRAFSWCLDPRPQLKEALWSTVSLSAEMVLMQLAMDAQIIWQYVNALSDISS